MKRGLSGALLRLFAVQGSMNYDRMTGVGVAWATEPLLRDLPGGVGGAAYGAAMRRAAQFFNTHPYLAGLAVGATARAEHDALPGEQIERLRVAMSGPLGSVGDQLVWAGVLPATLGVALVLGATVHPLLGAAAFLLSYNAVHLVLRVWGLRAGWRLGPALARALAVPAVQFGLRIAGPAVGLALGFALPVVVAALTSGLDGPTRIGVGVVAIAGFVVDRWVTPSLGAVRLGLLAVGAALVAGWVWPS